jgi:DNA-binding beta-propeller fold protein YncE
VTDHFNDRVQRFGGDGHFQAQLGSLQVSSTSATSGASAATAGAATTLAAVAAPTVGLTLAAPPALATAQPAASVSAPVVPAVIPDVQLRRPEGVAIDHDGNLWVADYGRDRVVKFAPDGRPLLSWGGRGSGLGEFVGPKGVAIDPSSGHLYVADTGNARVQRLAPDGTAEAAWPLPAVTLP